MKTHLFLGEETLVEYAKKLGITSKLEANASLPLGTNEIPIIQFVNAYGIFANTGIKIKGHLIRKIEDGNGDIIYEYKNETCICGKSSTYG